MVGALCILGVGSRVVHYQPLSLFARAGNTSGVDNHHHHDDHETQFAHHDDVDEFDHVIIMSLCSCLLG